MNTPRLFVLGLVLLLSTVLLPQAQPMVLLVAGVAVFLGIQLAIFKLVGLRSAADQGGPEAPPADNLTPIQWGLRNDQMLNLLERELEQRNTWQGRHHRASSGSGAE